MLAQQLRSQKERTLYSISAVISVLAWIALVISLVGIAYGVFILALVLIAHALFLAYITMNGVRVSKTQLPELYKKIVRASERLGLAAPPETYVLQAGGTLNAFATKLFSRQFIILFSDILEACDDASGDVDPEAFTEVDFIIAHEIGHLAAGHLAKAAFLLPAAILPWLGPAYSRACEYTCDACGHAVVGNLEVSSRALAILAAGGRYARRLNLDEFVRQRQESGQFWAAVYELNSSHPYLPKRIAMLRELANPGSTQPVGRSALAYILAPAFGFASGGGAGVGGLMMMVAIIGILAAIAIPNFVAMQLRAKRSELPVSVDSIRLAAINYAQAHDGAVLPCGDAELANQTVGKEERDWTSDPAASCFEQLGWTPGGAVRGSYWIVVTEEEGSVGFRVYGTSDLDGDGDNALFMATQDEGARMMTDNRVY